MDNDPSESPIYDRVLQEEQDQQSTQALRNKQLKERNQSLAALGLIGQLGITMVVSITLPLLFGLWLDRTFDLLPLFTLIFTLLGMVVALRNLLVLTAHPNTVKKRKANKHSHKRG